MDGMKIGIITLFSLLFLYCEKTTNLLPAKTHEGRNTFGYRTNDKLIGSLFGGFDDHFIFGDSTIKMIYDERKGAHLTKNDYSILSFSLSYNEEATFILTAANYSIKNDRYEMENVFTLDSGFINFVEVTYVNFDKKVLSGLFEFNFKPSYTIQYSDTLEAADSTESVHVWDGRFDLREND